MSVWQNDLKISSGYNNKGCFICFLHFALDLLQYSICFTLDLLQYIMYFTLDLLQILVFFTLVLLQKLP